MGGGMSTGNLFSRTPHVEAQLNLCCVSCSHWLPMHRGQPVPYILHAVCILQQQGPKLPGLILKHVSLVGLCRKAHDIFLHAPFILSFVPAFTCCAKAKMEESAHSVQSRSAGTDRSLTDLHLIVDHLHHVLMSEALLPWHLKC